jgi:hypothetical protein
MQAKFNFKRNGRKTWMKVWILYVIKYSYNLRDSLRRCEAGSLWTGGAKQAPSGPAETQRDEEEIVHL